MFKTWIYIIALSTLAVFICGCQGTSPAIPDESIPGVSPPGGDGSRVIWGAYHVTFKPESMEATVEQASRELPGHFDVTDWVTPPDCLDCLKVKLLAWHPDAQMAVARVTLKNPTNITGYDVRAVAQDYGLKEFLGPNGYTDKWGAGVRQPFYSFAIEEPNRAFAAYATYSRDIEVHFPPGATGDVTILVDASWPGKCKEPYELHAAASSWLINDGNDGAKIVAYVFDHQGDIEAVTVNLSPLGGIAAFLYDDGNHGDGEVGDGIFAVQGINTTVAHGVYDVWVSARSFGSQLVTHNIVKVTVSDVDPFRGDPDYDRIFNEDEVKRINIFMPPDQWVALQDNLEDQIPLPWEDRDFDYFECEVECQGIIWQHVGMRYKGNSSIQAAWDMGRMKYPFRLDFDEYENDFPETNNQRFWGMKWLIFNNNMNDPAMLRELLTYGLFREFNVPSSRVAHYRVFIDHGMGPVYFGLYSCVEEVDNRFLTDKFTDNDGNLYEPTHADVPLSQFNKNDFEKITNEGADDWTDLEHFIDVLNAPYATPAEFKDAVTQVFHVESFLSFLAVNNTLCNIDSYVGTGHNYFLYNNPVDDLFYLIPWDCNESMGGFCGSIGPDAMPTWDILDPAYESPKPLVDRILWVPEYMDAYKAKVRVLLDGPFAEPAAHFRMDVLHNIARPYVIGPDGEFHPYTLLGSQEEFDLNVDEDVPLTGWERHLGLKSFLANRRAYIDTVIP